MAHRQARWKLPGVTERDTAPDRRRRLPTPVVFGGLLGGLIIAATLHEGAFYAGDAALVASVSLLVAIPMLRVTGDRRALVAAGATSTLALWWLIRAASQGRPGAFLPFGASAVGFSCALLVTRNLDSTHRLLATQLVACLGAVEAAVGLWAVSARWYPIAMPAQNLWRVSTTLTYSNAAGALLAISLLLSLGLDQRLRTTRLTVSLCAAGLVATQSRGAVLAALVAVVIVPRKQLIRAMPSLLLGIVAGLIVVGSSHGGTGRPWVIIFVVLVIGGATALKPPSKPRVYRTTSAADPRRRHVQVAILATFFALGVGVLIAAGFLLRGPIQARLALGSSQDRSYEWHAAFDQWRSAPIVGVGPDKTLTFQAPDGNYANFAHNEYLQVLADGGIVGALLLAATGVAVARAVRRVDVQSSCAVAALLSFAIAASLDFDWHLASLGLVAGWVAGLAAGAHTEEQDRPPSGLWCGEASASLSS